jgi:putative flippase GtrA
MSDRTRQFLAEVSRFLVVGGAATIVALVLFNWLVHGFDIVSDPLLARQPYLGYVIANTVGMVISYHGSRHWAFRDRSPSHRHGGWPAYVAINVATMTLPVACLWLSRSALGLDDPISDNLSANVVGLALGLAARFYLFRRFVFQRPIHLTELYDDPVTDRSTDRSTTGRVRTSAP